MGSNILVNLEPESFSIFACLTKIVSFSKSYFLLSKYKDLTFNFNLLYNINLCSLYKNFGLIIKIDYY